MKRGLAGGAGLLLALSLTACGDSDDSHPAAATQTTAVATPTATPTPTPSPKVLGSTPVSDGHTAMSFDNGGLDACRIVTPELLASDLQVNGGRAGRKASSLGDAGEVLDCLYQGDSPGEADVVVRATVHADRDLPSGKYTPAAGAEQIPGADRGWVDLYGVYDHPQARVLLVKGQTGFYIDISSENYRLDVDELQQLAQDVLEALG